MIALHTKPIRPHPGWLSWEDVASHYVLARIDHTKRPDYYHHAQYVAACGETLNWMGETDLQPDSRLQPRCRECARHHPPPA